MPSRPESSQTPRQRRWPLISLVIFGVLESDSFLTASNFQTMFGSQAVLLVLFNRVTGLVVVNAPPGVV